MKSGIIRRFDALGRIVIPKEIRKALYMHEVDPIEISVSGNKICMEKYNPLEGFSSYCELYLWAYSKFGGAAAICGVDRVIAARGVSIPADSILSIEVQSLIHNYSSYQYDADQEIVLLRNGSFTINALFPIGVKDEPVGAMVLIRVKDITTEQLACAEMTASILTELVKNQ